MTTVGDAGRVLGLMEAFIADVQQRAKAANIAPEAYFELSSIGLPELDTPSGPLDERRRRQLLINLSIVGGAQGTSRVWMLKDGEQTSKTTIAGARAVIDALAKKEQLTKEELSAAIAPSGADEARVISLLKGIDLVAGVRGRTGGIQWAHVAANEFAEAERKIADVEKEDRKEEDEVRQHESVYYLAAADALRFEGFSVTITGVRQRARGEWSSSGARSRICDTLFTMSRAA
jgi:hypothetical protein